MWALWGIGEGHVAELFEDRCIDGLALMTMEDEHLSDLGVVELKDRNNILNMIKYETSKTKTWEDKRKYSRIFLFLYLE